MKILNSFYNKKHEALSFTSRVAPVRDAQWVCHAINTTFPHFSSTKFKPMFEHYVQKSISCYNTPASESIEGLNCFINNYIKGINVSIPEKIKNLLYHSKYKNKIKILSAIKRNIDEIGLLRKKNEEGKSQLEKTLDMVCLNRRANCQENAMLAEFVLKLNGIKNAQTCNLFKKQVLPLEPGLHSVCVFNLDGSPFNEKIINNKTIIIDPWIGKADFANNMLNYYKNNCENLLVIDGKNEIKSFSFDRVFLSDADIEKYKTEFPQLIFRSNGRKFMQKR